MRLVHCIWNKIAPGTHAGNNTFSLYVRLINELLINITTFIKINASVLRNTVIE